MIPGPCTCKAHAIPLSYIPFMVSSLSSVITIFDNEVKMMIFKKRTLLNDLSMAVNLVQKMVLGILGIDRRTLYMRISRSTTELHPPIYNLLQNNPNCCYRQWQWQYPQSSPYSSIAADLFESHVTNFFLHHIANMLYWFEILKLWLSNYYK